MKRGFSFFLFHSVLRNSRGTGEFNFSKVKLPGWAAGQMPLEYEGLEEENLILIKLNLWSSGY